LSAHLSSSLYGIAEKAAVMIKEDQCLSSVCSKSMFSCA
jgi:hypothetical protein